MKLPLATESHPRGLVEYKPKGIKVCATLHQPLVALLRVNKDNNNSSEGYSIVGTVNETDGSLALNQTIPPLNSTDDLIYGRLCECAANGTYCPVGTDRCLVDADRGLSPGVQIFCLDETQQAWMRFVFPLAVFLLIFFSVLLFCSPKGHYAKGYMKKILCCWDSERYDRALMEEISVMAQRVQRRRQAALAIAADHRNRVYIPGNAPSIERFDPDLLVQLQDQRRQRQEQAPRVLVRLRTRPYVPNEEQQEGEADACAICLGDLNRDDRVTDLQCGHVFHVECLKTWIQRQNHCPLCKRTNETFTESNPAE